MAWSLLKDGASPVRSVSLYLLISVAERLSKKETHEAFTKLHEAIKTPDPDNPNLWVVTVAGYTLWGIFDPGAGPSKEDVLTLLFPEDY